ncbi:glycosyltransferase [Photobacterium damselae]|uniref:glycosyltransferase n=1 Tax=Photobacterium damselae TaxID=38293 RepID=UPI00254331C3|nr:glycosyltransferase [Photobacterium damselae]WIH20894.1 glycosyltransferase [Photobacterium damselae]
MSNKPFISVIIKTFNEEDGIEKTIQSIKARIGEYPHKIIVADSLSIDNTQSIAIKNQAEVITLVDPNDRCCGVGHQLGYQISEGDYLLLLDGDMELEDGFLEQGILFLEQNPTYAGVAGLVEMDDAASYEFKSRKQRMHKIYPIGDCNHLGGGGLYRKSAIDAIGYLTNKNLHAYEEAELGMRLSTAGYKLRRLDIPYFKHTSYNMSSSGMLKYRWENGYLFASGELLRNTWGKPYFFHALYIVKNEAIFSIYLFLLFWAVLSTDITAISFALLPVVAFWVVKALKNRSLKDATQSVINLSVFAAGLVRGVFIVPKDPTQAPKSRLVK